MQWQNLNLFQRPIEIAAENWNLSVWSQKIRMVVPNFECSGSKIPILAQEYETDLVLKTRIVLT